ncbi:unnamed protein product [Rotaria socialis]|uniref:G-protein coupled receptors family 1 profile domain-containing protein n=1 Tax=Rotaria socialis TaxID=392032 RepID=A0A821D4K6_9BILA|nr:unnamed protein product [Rotaria socialis]
MLTFHYVPILCKLRNYSISISGFLSQSYLLLACIDRYLISANESSYRQFNTIPMANRIIMFTIMFWLTILSHKLVYSNISSPHQFCFYSGASYTFLISLHNLILSGSILSILMATFSILTLKNIRQIRRQTRSCGRRHHCVSLMLISNVFVSVIFTFIYVGGLISVSFFLLTKAQMLSTRQKVRNKFISFIVIIFYYTPYVY